MIIGFGSAPKKVLLGIRDVKKENVLIYPEFFDSKSDLINRRYDAYVRKIKQWINNIIVALYPDYVYSPYLCKRYDNIMWVFPLHSLSEIERIPDCITFIGYASQQNLRDYTLSEFLKSVKGLGYPLWYLGANSREIYEAVTHKFDGVDVTTLSIPGWSYKDNIKHGHLVAKWLEALSEGRILKAKQLFKPSKPLTEVG